jgi:hypothetical protein
MPTHDPRNSHDPRTPKSPNWANSAESDDLLRPQQDSDSESKKAGYELADANVREAAIFLVVLGASLAVVFVLAFGIGKLIYMEMGRQDGPTDKWSQMSGAKPGNLESDPQIQQQQLKALVKRFPTPRLETDDGNMDVAEMHAREDVLLDHYSWVDEQKQTVRIPISRAMQLLAQRGLPVEGQQAGEQAKNQHETEGQQKGKEQAMFGDSSNAVTAPLTDGFARTGPELQMIQIREQRLENGTLHNAQAELHPAK